MNAHEDRAGDYLLHMRDALDRILKYTAGLSEGEFLSSDLIQDAVVRNIGIVGEAAKQLFDAAPEFSKNRPEIPFAEVYEMRNRVIHGYASVDPRVVWDSVVNDVPGLRRQVAELLTSFLAE